MRRLLPLFVSCVLLTPCFAGSKYSIQQRETENKTETAETENTDVLEKRISINVKSVPLPYFLSVLSQEAGIPIILRDINYQQRGLQGLQGQAAVPTMMPGSATALPPAMNEYMSITYFSLNKTLKDILEEITGSLDLWWRKEENRIVIYKYERRMFELTLPYVQKEIDEKSDAITLSYKREFLKGIDTALKSLLSDPESKISVDEMGNIFVYARKQEMENIEQAIKGINKRSTKQIPLKINVYLVKEEDLTKTGINILGKANNLSGELTSGVSDSIFSLSLLTKNFELGISALAQSGKAKVIEDTLLYALNGQPMVYTPSKKQRIVSNYQLTFTAPTGTGMAMQAIPNVSITTEDVVSGSMLIIVPYYVDDNRIVVDLYRKQATVDKIETKTVDLSGFKNDVFLPTISTKTSLNQTLLSKGQGIVLFSSAMTLDQMREAGIPFLKDIPALGYLFSNKEKVKELYRMIITINFIDTEI